jgi:CSLREA domain-containing protein
MVLYLTSNKKGRRRWYSYTTLVVPALLALCATGVHRPTAQAAAAFTVNSTGDGADSNISDGVCDDGMGHCTLRAAIQQANANLGGDEVNFGVTGTINLSSALPTLLTNITISGPGANRLTVRRDTGGDYRIFRVPAGVTAAISGLTVTNGRAPLDFTFNPAGGGGGGIHNAGALTLTDCAVSGNTTIGPPGRPLDSLAGGGGGIHNDGTLTITRCTVSNNSTGSTGAGEPAVQGGSGGGIFNTGTLTMTECIVRGNSTGAGFVSDVTSTPSGNGGDGGGIANTDAAASSSPESVAASATIIDSTISENRTGKGGDFNGGSGGGLGAAGSGGRGGGIFNTGTLTITRSTLNANRTGDGGSAPPGVPANAGDGGGGGGIYTRAEGNNLLTATNCTISGNTAGDGGTRDPGTGIGSGDGGDGGGINNESIASNGGIDAESVKLSNSTIVFNATGRTHFVGSPSDAGHGGGIDGGVRIRSTIVALNTAPGLGPDVQGHFLSSGHNLIGNADGGLGFTTSDLRGGGGFILLDPLIEPLADNGGPTRTHALREGSIAIDSGIARDLDGQPVTTDQRGRPRPVDDPAVGPQVGGDNSDIGAFERQAVEPPPPNVQFGDSTFQVVEGCVQTEVTVTRAAPTDGTSVVAYVVNNGTATQRGDFTYASGTVTFAPNETSKTIPVLITDDAYAEGSETATVQLTAVSGATIGAPATATLQIDDNETADGATNTIDDPATFVCQHYHDFLNRQADPDGQAFWTGQITACGNDPGCLDARRVEVSAAFFLSIEFQATGYFVIRTHKAAFGDTAAHPRYVRFLEDTQRMGRGVVVGQAGFEAVLEANRQAYLEQFVSTPEFLAAHGSQTAEQYVNSLFANTGAVPTQAERQAALSAFGSGGTSGRAAALRRVVESASVFNRLKNPAFVLMQYFGYLRRNPDNPPDNDLAGFNFWLQKLNNHGGDFRSAEMVRSFLVSGEYRGRFHNDPNRGAQFGFIAMRKGPGWRRFLLPTARLGFDLTLMKYAQPPAYQHLPCRPAPLFS